MPRRRRLFSHPAMIHRRELPCALGSLPMTPWTLVARTTLSRSLLGQGLADDLLGLAEGVDVGGVDEIDPRIERAVDDADRLVVIGGSPRPEHHGAQAQRADLDTGTTKSAIVHAGDGSHWPGSRSRAPGSGVQAVSRAEASAAASNRAGSCGAGMAAQRRFGQLQGVWRRPTAGPARSTPSAGRGRHRRPRVHCDRCHRPRGWRRPPARRTPSAASWSSSASQGSTSSSAKGAVTV